MRYVFSLLALLGLVAAATAQQLLSPERTSLCGSMAVNNPSDEAVLDAVEERMNPVPHCFIHGRLDTDRYFRIQLPGNWNRKFVLTVEGGHGGSEFRTVDDVFGANHILAEGYAVAASNQGRNGPVFDHDDSFEELSLTANHQLALYAQKKIAQVYGQDARRKYAYGYSGGALRSLVLLEAHPELFDGAAIGHPASMEGGRYGRNRLMSLFDRLYPAIAPKVNAIVAARDKGEDPLLTAGLTPAQAEALNQLYDSGFVRGSEFYMPRIDPFTVGLGYFFTLLDSTYFDDFWTQPGYEGHDGLAAAEVVSGVTGRITSLPFFSTLPDPTAIPLPRMAFEATLSHSYATNRAKGYQITFTSGVKAGQTFDIAIAAAIGTPNSVNQSISITGQNGGLDGIAVGDTFVMDNRKFVAWTYYHRHITDCDLAHQQRFCANDKPIYVQRPEPVRERMRRRDTMLDGTIRVPVVLSAGVWDPLTWSASFAPYFDRVRAYQAENRIDGLRLYWTENVSHGDPIADHANRAVEFRTRGSTLLYSLLLLDRWVDQGIVPPDSTVMRMTPGSVVLPATAAERKGIQPVVVGTANGIRDLTVRSGANVRLDGLAESPFGQTIVRYEWDFGDDAGAPDYDCAEGSAPGAPVLPRCDGGAPTSGARISTPAEHVYATPGTYFATVKVYDGTDVLGPFDGFRNLSRVVLRVVP